jgi:hypothetical protein
MSVPSASEGVKQLFTGGNGANGGNGESLWENGIFLSISGKRSAGPVGRGRQENGDKKIQPGMNSNEHQ